MLKSRDINMLRPDVAANCHTFVRLCAAAGYPVKVTDTVRDDEYQMQCYRNGTGGRPPATFHSVHAGLAFDVVKLLPNGGIDYNDQQFWNAVGQIGKCVGFSWGFSLWGYDKPHFQWDAHGKFTDKNIIAKKYPPMMPKYEEVEDMTAEQTQAMIDKALADRDTTVATANAKTASWSADAWELAKQRGVFDGMRPGAPLTRQEAALVLRRLGVLK